MPGDQVEFVALADGRLVVEEGFTVDPDALAAGLAGSLHPPFPGCGGAARQGLGRRWVGDRGARLDPDPDDDLELSWDGETLALAADGIPVDVERAGALRQLASERQRGPYVARARRLEGSLFGLSILPL